MLFHKPPLMVEPEASYIRYTRAEWDDLFDVIGDVYAWVPGRGKGFGRYQKQIGTVPGLIDFFKKGTLKDKLNENVINHKHTDLLEYALHLPFKQLPLFINSWPDSIFSKTLKWRLKVGR